METILQNIVLVINSAEFWGVMVAVGIAFLAIWKVFGWVKPMPEPVNDLIEDRIEEFVEYAKEKQAEIKAKTDKAEAGKQISVDTQNKVVEEIKETKEQDVFTDPEETNSEKQR